MTKRFRCAVYTRKSTEEGLEQDFNSLDAQREACEAFIASQRSLGWSPLSTRYDDGGISGGTMDRPALQTLLKDIEEHQVDLVVVYKVDRLTRSLSDFAKMVDLFEAEGVSFVSVTQQFNTSTSMGRLTLNVLLSFAQFEREVTGERIRDKIAASKKKGLWMGGLAPLGYDARDKKLVVNPTEAKTVRSLFKLYLELGTVRALLTEATRRGLRSKARTLSDDRSTGNKPFTRGHLYQLLVNPIYVGDVVHKGIRYPGQHKAIIDRQTYNTVQAKLAANAAYRRTDTNTQNKSLLAGLVYDETGDKLCPTHAVKKGRRYRYYISKRLMHATSDLTDGWRLPAQELENAVTQALSDWLADEHSLIQHLGLNATTPTRIRSLLNQTHVLSDRLNEPVVLKSLVRKITLLPDTLTLEINKTGLVELIGGSDTVFESDLAEPLAYTVPLQVRRRGVEAKLVIKPNGQSSSKPDASLIGFIAQAHRWMELLTSGQSASINDVAQQDGIHATEVSRSIQLAFLAPDIVESILAGRQPVALTAERLKRIGILPKSWAEQRKLLGFSG